MKYEVTFKCGHTGRVDIIGSHAMREYKLELAEQGNCPDCEAKATQHKAKNSDNNNNVVDGDVYDYRESTGYYNTKAEKRAFRRFGC